MVSITVSANKGMAADRSNPTTLVFPPYLHTLGIRKATKYHLFLFMQNRVRFKDPQDLAVVRLNCTNDPDDDTDDDEVTVYGVNSGQHNIIYNKSMTSLGVYGIYEHGEEKLNHPMGITADNLGNVYVADKGHDRIVRLYNDGQRLKYVSQIGDKGNGNGQFNSPYDVCQDSNGRLFVVDSGNDRIQVFDKNDKFSDILVENLLEPTALIVSDSNQRWSYFGDQFIVVVDSNRARIQKFTLHGKLLRKISMHEAGYGECELSYIATDYYNNIYITDKFNHCIHKFDHMLNYLTSFGRRGNGDNEFTEPRGIAIHRRFGQVFIAEREGAQYYWIGTDCTHFAAKQHKKSFIKFEYILTEPSFVTVDIHKNNEFITRIWNKRFKHSGNQFDYWNCLTINYPDSVLREDHIDINHRYDSGEKIEQGTYKARCKIEATYSSYKKFKKVLETEFEVNWNK